jgi:hypothetical protein
MYHLTDSLLTIVEGKPRYRQAFGFDKGQSEPVDTGGKNLAAICADVARALFLTDQDPDSEPYYSEADLPDLGGVVKNRMNAYVHFF